MRPLSIGLRAQLILALSIAFIAAFTLLGIATVQLTQRARSLDRYHEVKESCERLANELAGAREGANLRFETLSAALIGRNGVTGLEWNRPAGELRAGAMAPEFVRTERANGDTFTMWYRAPLATDATPVTNLLLLYVATTGGAILLITYVWLTYLIVRPLEAVTRAAGRLARGNPFAAVPERGAAEVVALASSFNDMATQLRHEQERMVQRVAELEHTTAELRTARDQLVRSEQLASVGRLSAGVAHEIGNPLAAILGMLEILRSGDLEHDDQAEFLRRIQAETERIHKIIRDLLDFSRQGAGGPVEGTANLVSIVEDAVRLIAPQKDLRGVTIERRLQEDLRPVRGSADQITQVVLNLLLNAADAVQGQGTIQIEVLPSKDGKHAVLAVSDSGPGIAPEVLGRLFEPFVTTKPAGSGTGLGLAVCHTIIERLGGTMHALNRDVGGARFEIALPFSTGKSAPPGGTSS